MPSVLPAVACLTSIMQAAYIGQNMPIRNVPSVITISDSGNPSRQ
jgi:hypothetical protein